jgi:hypothetical protein
LSILPTAKQQHDAEDSLFQIVRAQACGASDINTNTTRRARCSSLRNDQPATDTPGRKYAVNILR